MNKEKIIEACAKTFILSSDNIFRDPSLIKPFWSKQAIPPTLCQIEYCGGRKAILGRIKAGLLRIDKHLDIWNSSFISGLKNSAFFCYYYSYNGFLIRINKHRELIQDFKELKIPCRIGKVYKNTIIYISRFYLSLYPNENGYNRSYISGLLAGSEIIKVKGEEWLYLCGTRARDEVKALIDEDGRKKALEQWTIIYKEYNGGLLISPFYGALFSLWMPVHSASRMLSLNAPAMCPELSVLYWNIATKGKSDRMAPTWVDELPYCVSYGTVWNRKMNYKDMRMRGVELGILGVDTRLRAVMKGWAEWHKSNRMDEKG